MEECFKNHTQSAYKTAFEFLMEVALSPVSMSVVQLILPALHPPLVFWNGAGSVLGIVPSFSIPGQVLKPHTRPTDCDIDFSEL
jgi:hypothetical protein